MLTWKLKMFITLVITPAFVNFLAFHETNIVSSKFKNFVSYSIFRGRSFFVHGLGGRFGASVCRVRSWNKHEKMALRSLEKEVILSRKSMENHSQTSVWTL